MKTVSCPQWMAFAHACSTPEKDSSVVRCSPDCAINMYPLDHRLLFLQVSCILTIVAAVVVFKRLSTRSKIRNRRPSGNVDRNQRRIQEGSGSQTYRDLFFKLHHLEKHTDVLDQARAQLLQFLSNALTFEKTHHSAGSILSVENFSDTALDDFVHAELDSVTQEWHEYLVRRKQGHPRDYFQTADEARRWLVRMAPNKFVDGAWLGHIHKASTPFADRATTKAAWQVLSEELGDGDLAKCHVHVFQQLLKEVGASVGEPSSVGFGQHPDMDSVCAWRSACAQLTISLFPHEFLPEILGFNLHFEMLTYETLVASKELREVGYNPYYFTLHITIDNAATGHTAMASHIVKKYLHSVLIRQGEDAAHEAWKRVQAGYLLSKNISSLPDTELRADRVLDVFQAKTIACNRIHDHCPVRIGKRSLSTWLEPESFSQLAWQNEFLHRLGNTKPWVYKGDSGRSRLIRQLSWGGSMFGAFTDSEVDIVRDWIDSLAINEADPYVNFTGRSDLQKSLREPRRLGVDYPVFSHVVFDHVDTPEGNVAVALDTNMANLDIDKLAPLWFTHPCLLESSIAVPWDSASTVGCAAVRLLRAQNGFLPEPTGVAGVDEMHRGSYIDLTDIGTELLARLTPSDPLPQTLGEVLDRWPSPFAEKMLAAAMQPHEYIWLLLGIAQAFVQLHSALSSLAVLSLQTREALRLMAAREQESLQACLGDLRRDKIRYMEFCRGYALGKREIEACFISV